MLVCFGTRPEYIKVKSLIDNLNNVKTCFTGQHKDLLKNIKVDYELNMDETISENRLNNIICNILKNTYIFEGVEKVLVQGDTTSALAMALSAFNNGIKVIHLEAGLRSNDLKDPYPEEANRQLISRIADIHLCPTEFNKENLLKENVKGEIYVTGNTGLDNITKEGCEYTNKVLITMHRRDNHEQMDKWFENIEKIACKYGDIEFLIPLHPNPNVQKHKNIFNKVKVVEPMTHEEIIEYVKKCKFVISDSGGLQEECSFLNKKIIVCRKTTERPESVGIHSFMCFSPNKLEKMVDEIIVNYEVDALCPYGNGESWKNIKFSIHKLTQQYKLTHRSLITPTVTALSTNTEIYGIKCLFITGGAGFIGSNFINLFCEKYPFIKVINFDALYYCGNKDNINKSIQKSPNYTFIEGNLQSIDLLKYIYQTNIITHVIHFAAQSHVQNSFENSLQYTQDNIMGTHNLLEVNRLYNSNLIKFIHVSTDEVYGESMLDVDEKHKTEHSVLCPTNPYAATKAAAELIAQSYNHSFKMPIIITRGNNVYGPNQYPEKLIPRFIQLLQNNNKVTIQGDGTNVRAFLHAYDTATAFETILLKGKIGEIYNIGCDEGMEYTVIDVAKILIKLIKNTENYDEWITYIEDRPFNDKRYYISNKKVKDLGWSINVKFEDGIKNLV